MTALIPALPVLPFTALPELPRTLHMIWVGPADIPDYVTYVWDLWEQALTPYNWTFRFWTNETIKGTPLAALPSLHDRYGFPWRGVADMIRVMAVSLYGGVYADCDAVCLDPQRLTEEFTGPTRGAWLGTAPRTRHQSVIVNATFGFPAHHPFLADMWVYALHQLERGITNEHFVAGPRSYRKVWEAGHSDTVEVDWTFDTEWDAPLQQQIKKLRVDLPALRAQFPDCGPVLHIVLR